MASAGQSEYAETLHTSPRWRGGADTAARRHSRRLHEENGASSYARIWRPTSVGAPIRDDIRLGDSGAATQRPPAVHIAQMHQHSRRLCYRKSASARRQDPYLAEVLKKRLRTRRGERRSRFHNVPARGDLEGLCRDVAAHRSNRAQSRPRGHSRKRAHDALTAADASAIGRYHQDHHNLSAPKFMIPGLGAIQNKYMNLYDPRQGQRCRWAGKASPHRWPMMALPTEAATRSADGGKRSAEGDAGVDKPDRPRMSLRRRSSPRVWTESNAPSRMAAPDAFAPNFVAMGHKCGVPRLRGMNAYSYEVGPMSGAACGARRHAVGIAGGPPAGGVGLREKLERSMHHIAARCGSNSVLYGKPVVFSPWTRSSTAASGHYSW